MKDHTQHWKQHGEQDPMPMPMPVPHVPPVPTCLSPTGLMTLSQSTTVSEAHSLQSAPFPAPPPQLSAILPCQSSNDPVSQLPTLSALSQTLEVPEVIAATTNQPPDSAPGPDTPVQSPSISALAVRPPSQDPDPIPNPTTTDNTPTLVIPYPLAIHIAILSTLCPTLSHPSTALSTTVTLSPDMTISSPPAQAPLPATAPAQASSLGFVPSVLASLQHLTLPSTHPNALLAVDTCSATWDLDKLVHDPDVGVLASCVDLASLCVLEPVKSQHDHPSQQQGAVGWHVVPESVGDYWAYLMKSTLDPGLMAQLTSYFGEYLDRRGKLASAQFKHTELMAALGPDTTEQQAKAALKDHIHNLHVYNEYQDLAQCIMGQLADMDGVTVKQVYEELGIDLDEPKPRKKTA
ncbi:hypothetical protein BCR44DRAFT_60934 [Catenaria anguillulae PL171]|uniref:Swi5-domain-containing protein n=1 Tax=Catenaria anguillulae PL171 TaxID=765915 RepID=A0A1Y2HWB3_9FUNG|nr:hypothetical protein BCR44DRAFT_60934 [Catenaria anguillulae PL171]